MCYDQLLCRLLDFSISYYSLPLAVAQAAGVTLGKLATRREPTAMKLRSVTIQSDLSHIATPSAKIGYKRGFNSRISEDA